MYLRFFKFFFFAITSIFLAGCGSTVQFGLSATGQSFKQSASAFTNKLDILWVIDNSGSMSPFQANLTSNFKPAIDGFNSKGWDFRMAVTTTDAYKADPNWVGYSSGNASMAKFRDGTDVTSHTGVFVIMPTTPNFDQVFVTNATQGAAGSGDERAFSSMRTALDSSLNAGFVRPDSFFAVIVLSDEDDFSSASRTENSWGSNNALDHCYVNQAMDTVATTAYTTNSHVGTCSNQTPPDSVGSYVNYLDKLTSTTGAFRRYNVSSITVLDNACLAQHTPSTPVTTIGQRYVQLSQATNGVLGSICDSSFSSSLMAIANQIAVLSTQFFLQVIPQVNSITVAVNGIPVPQDPNNGWTYSSAANSIQFHGTAIPANGSAISVNFLPTGVLH